MNQDDQSNEREICIHIFGVSAALVGVCLTVIGIFRAISALKDFSTIGDDILAVNALIFLAACMFAYFALRSNHIQRKRQLEKLADTFFLAGLSLMTIVCALITYTLL